MRIDQWLTVFSLGALLTITSSGWAQDNISGAPAQPQVAQPEQQSGVNWKGVGIGAGTAAGNLVYVPAKLAYGILGGIAGGAGYALTGGNKQVADTIWRSSLGGDYVLTPNMITGKDPVHFSGPTSTAPTASADQSTAAPPPVGNTSTGPLSAGAPPTSSVAASTVPDSTGATTHSIDSGAGPVPTSSNHFSDTSIAPAPYSSGSGSHQDAAAPAIKTAPPLPSTSIE